MKIDELLITQAGLTQKHQAEFQLLVKRTIKQHGFRSQKTREILKKEISRYAEKATRQNLQIGMDWLQHGETTDNA
ncbi:MAG: hypothetical protein K9N34_03620 [Candidatus Marinimicrobia bacterium]|nr:hypothetical protein [Candidatus Neomarinimicrobiota bacterium]MCF7839783.1 hypothetical protein [Candidatus Neomarinimicrobiota bacterium]